MYICTLVTFEFKHTNSVKRFSIVFFFKLTLLQWPLFNCTDVYFNIKVAYFLRGKLFWSTSALWSLFSTEKMKHAANNVGYCSCVCQQSIVAHWSEPSLISLVGSQLKQTINCSTESSKAGRDAHARLMVSSAQIILLKIAKSNFFMISKKTTTFYWSSFRNVRFLAFLQKTTSRFRTFT